MVPPIPMPIPTHRPSSPRFTRLTYKSAAKTSPPPSDPSPSPLTPNQHRPPSQTRRNITHRAATLLSDAPPTPTPSQTSERAMSLSCIPPSAAYHSDHICSRCRAPSPSPPPPRVHRSSQNPPPILRPTKLFRPISPDPSLPRSQTPPPFRPDGPTPSSAHPHRTRSSYKPSPLSYRAFAVRARSRGPRSPRPLPSSPHRDRVLSAAIPTPPRHTPPTRHTPPVRHTPSPRHIPPPRNTSASRHAKTKTPPRAVYNATTASARAAELAASKGRGAFLEPARPVGRPNQLCDDLGVVPSTRADAVAPGRPLSDNLSSRISPDPRTVSRIVVKRRLIRGSSVFRSATEEDIEELLQGEHFREMVRVHSADVDIPPVQPSAVPISRTDTMDESERELCAQCAAPMTAAKRPPPPIAMPMRGVRRVSSLLSRHLGLEGDNTLDIAEMATMDERTAVAMFLTEIRRQRKEMAFGMQDKALERAADQAATRPRKKDVRKGGRDRKYARDVEKLHKKLWQQRSLSADDPALMRALYKQEHLLNTHAANRRYRIRPGLKGDIGQIFTKVEDDTDDEFSRERSQSELVSRFGLKQAELDERWKRVMSNFSRVGDDGEGKGNKEDGAKRATGGMYRVFGGTTEKRGTTYDDDEYAPHEVRILTAIEPVDPTMGLEDMDARRGTSYHMGTSGLGVAGSRKRVIAGLRGVHGGGDTGLLRRFRSMRRRPDDRYVGEFRH